MAETTTLLIEHEPQIRLVGFLGILGLMALVETVVPRRPRRQQRVGRWAINLAMVALGTLAMRLVIPILAVEAALRAQAAQWGLLNLLSLDGPAVMLAAVVLLDLAIYAQHVLFHRVPWLWRIHRMHHADLDLDVTSGLRFHPIEFVLSMLIKIAVVIALGLPPEAVILFEVILNVTAMFSHSNIRLPAGLDRALRLILVTPDMHIVHHSVRADETNRNFGFNLSLWDRLFGTYRAAPADGPVALTIGVPDRQSADRVGLGALLWMPFTKAERADAPTQSGASRP